MGLLLRLDGQNLDNTIGEVGDLSTLRGGSLALLDAPRALLEHLQGQGYEVTEVYSGASEGLFRVGLGRKTKADLKEDVTAFLAGRAKGTEPHLKEILPFLTIAWSVIRETGDEVDDQRTLTNLNREKQYRQPTVDLLPAGKAPVHLPCQIDRRRPGTEKDIKGEEKIKVSTSVWTRRRFGRKLRQEFYARELEKKLFVSPWGEYRLNDDTWVADSFEDIVQPWGQGRKPPKDFQVPEKLVNKMAVLYADGNGFNRIREENAKKLEDLTEFSAFVKTDRRALLQDVFTAMLRKSPVVDAEIRVPLETLLWGGDELCLVMPAWAALDVLAVVETSLKDPKLWTYQGHPLTHSLGLVIAHHHTPIREVRRLARDMADDAKGLTRERSQWQYQVLLGIDPPPDLGGFRRALYKTDDPAAFSLDFQGGFGQALEVIKHFKGVGKTAGVPLGRLLDLLHEAQIKGLLAGGIKANNGEFIEWRERFDEIMDRYSKDEERYGYDCLEVDGLLGYGERRPLMPLIHLIQLWDYVEPIPKGGKEGGKS